MPSPSATTIRISGTLTVPTGNPAAPTAKVVYQRTVPGLGNDPADPTKTQQIRAHVIPADPQTPAQLACRANMAAAVAAWQALSPEQRAAWITPGKTRNIGAYAAFISDFLKA